MLRQSDSLHFDEGDVLDVILKDENNGIKRLKLEVVAFADDWVPNNKVYKCRYRIILEGEGKPVEYYGLAVNVEDIQRMSVFELQEVPEGSQRGEFWPVQAVYHFGRGPRLNPNQPKQPEPEKQPITPATPEKDEADLLFEKTGEMPSLFAAATTTNRKRWKSKRHIEDNYGFCQKRLRNRSRGLCGNTTAPDCRFCALHKPRNI